MLCRSSFLLILLAACAFVAGCDGGDTDDRTDAERLIGTWDGTEASVSVIGFGTIPVLTKTGSGEISLQFREDGSYLLTAVGPLTATTPAPVSTEYVLLPAGVEQGIGDAYTLRESDKMIDFIGTGGQTFSAAYELEGTDGLVFALDNGDLIATLIEAAGADPFIATLIQGGEMALERR